MDETLYIGHHIREMRHMGGMSQLDLSAATGVAEHTISEIENGRRPRVRPSTLRKLADGLGVTVADLYTGDAIPKENAPKSEHKAEGRHMTRTSASHVEPIGGVATAEVDRQTLRSALHAVADGLLTPDEAEEKLLAGVA